MRTVVLRRLARLTVLTVGVCACGAVDDNGSSANRSPTPEDSSIAPAAGVDPMIDSSTADQVTEAYYALRPSGAAQFGLNVLNNSALRDALRACVEGEGLTFREYQTIFDEAPESDTSRNPNGVDAAWHIPPDVEGAAIGLGLAGPLDDDFQEEPNAEVPEDEEYLGVFADCASTVADPVSFDPTLMIEILDEFQEIGWETMELAGFADLNAEYVACVQSDGFEFTDPATLLSLAEAKYGEVEIEAAKAFERAIAVTDATCRQPLYSDFIELNSQAWQEELDARHDDIVAVASEFARLEAAVP